MKHSLAEKTKEVAHDIKEKLTPDVKDKDIAKAERKYNELKVKEDMDRFQAEGAKERRQELMSNAKAMEVSCSFISSKLWQTAHQTDAFSVMTNESNYHLRI